MGSERNEGEVSMTDKQESQSSDDLPFTGVRLYQVMMGLSDWTPAEKEWLKNNPEWLQNEEQLRETWHETRRAHPQIAKFLEREFRKMLDEKPRQR
jgi:hypothetical protein